MTELQLPTFYYHDHFMEMLSAVEQNYAHVLQQDHTVFIRKFRNLTRSAQCLFIRMANRRGHIFHRTTLAYAEIDHEIALVELHEQSFARGVSGHDFHAVLQSLDKDALVGLARHIADETARPSWTKARLTAHLAQVASFAHLQDHLDLSPYVVRLHAETLDFLLFLYFGRTFQDLKSFALRDLGIVAVNGTASVSARFIGAEEAEACFTYSRLLACLTSREAYEQAASSLTDGPAPTEYAELMKARLAAKLGQYFEKAAAPERAIVAYRTVDSPECNERLVRLLYNAGQQAEAKSLLERMIDDPGSDQEYEFAADFYARKFQGQRIGACTSLLRNSEAITIDEIYRNSPEIGAAANFRRDGWTAYWTENGFWHVLFGLLFWDELFGSNAILHSGFDRLPRCLTDRSFAGLYEMQIAAKLAALRDGAAAPSLEQTFAAHHGKPNGLIAWEGLDIAPILDCLEHASGVALTTMMHGMAQDFAGYRDGFPDLMLCKPERVRFVEIKAEGDAIRRNQLTRLRQLSRAGFDAAICRVDYRYDPEQTYVVVDIETTGGRASSHRIIEIGAVKMRNHEVIGQWHSMIDPECRIPAFITGLTGITDAMIAGAPRFADVADDFAAFMEDAVFVAHNVNFDYGFIAEEYQRLERRFRHPKFCTVANMRRHYPGHASYSLGTICKTFDISLKNHHRALDDAHAAARLLSLINRKREAVQDNRHVSSDTLLNQSA